MALRASFRRSRRWKVQFESAKVMCGKRRLTSGHPFRRCSPTLQRHHHQGSLRPLDIVYSIRYLGNDLAIHTFLQIYTYTAHDMEA